MTVAELIEELKNYNPSDTVVCEGCSWIGCNDPERFESEPYILEHKGLGKVSIGV